MRILNLHAGGDLTLKYPTSATTKKAVNLSIRVDVLEAARAHGINLSAVLESAALSVIHQARQRKWLEENRQAIAAYNEHVAEHGVFLRRRAGLLMAQCDVYRNTHPTTRDIFPLLLDVQSDLLLDLRTRVVIPLSQSQTLSRAPLATLTPALRVNGERYILVTRRLPASPRRSWAQGLRPFPRTGKRSLPPWICSSRAIDSDQRRPTVAVL